MYMCKYLCHGVFHLSEAHKTCLRGRMVCVQHRMWHPACEHLSEIRLPRETVAVCQFPPLSGNGHFLNTQVIGG